MLCLMTPVAAHMGNTQIYDMCELCRTAIVSLQISVVTASAADLQYLAQVWS